MSAHENVVDVDIDDEKNRRPPTLPPPFPLLDLNIDMLTEVAHALARDHPPSLLALAATSKLLASAAEPALRAACLSKGWHPSRRPRGDEALAAAAGPQAAWRALFRRRMCGACSARPGEFQAFEKRGGGWRGAGSNTETRLRFLLCRECVRLPRVSDKLAESDLRLDLVGLSGKRLLSAREEAELGVGDLERSAFFGGGRRGRGRGARGRGRGR